MSLKARLKFLQIKKQLSPSRDFKRVLGRTLSQAWDQQYGATPWYRVRLLYVGSALMAVVAVLIGGGAAYAYSSPTVTEGTILYPVKKAIEKVEEATKLTSEAKAKFYLKTIERREAERAIIKEHEPEDQGVELEPKEVISTETGKPEFRLMVKRVVPDKRIEKIDKSIQEAEDKLEKFNENLDKAGIKDNKLQEDVKVKIQQRLEKRKERREKESEVIKNKDERPQEIEDKKNEGRGGGFDLRNTIRVEKAGEQDGN